MDRPKTIRTFSFSVQRRNDLPVATGALLSLLLGDGDDVDLEVVELKARSSQPLYNLKIIFIEGKTYAHALKQVLGLRVDVELAGLGLGNIQSGDLRNVLILALTLLLLELEGDTADRATLDTLHKVGGVTSDLYQSSY